MKEKLLEYGISYDILNRQQLNSLNGFIGDIKSKNLESFISFISVLNNLSQNSQHRLTQLRNKINDILLNAIKCAESILPNDSDALLASFGKPYTYGDFQSKHATMLIKLSSLSDNIGPILDECEKLLSTENDDILTELSLRHIALAEYEPNAEIAAVYSELYDRRQSFFPKSQKDKAQEYSTSALFFESETKKLCSKADIAYTEFKDNSAAITSYYRLIREYISLMHQILLT